MSWSCQFVRNFISTGINMRIFTELIFWVRLWSAYLGVSRSAFQSHWRCTLARLWPVTILIKRAICPWPDIKTGKVTSILICDLTKLNFVILIRDRSHPSWYAASKSNLSDFRSWCAGGMWKRLGTSLWACCASRCPARSHCRNYQDDRGVCLCCKQHKRWWES